MSHAALMDRIYRFQRHFYDTTRRFFLLGRDALVGRMDLEDGDRVLEMGCGTARNLIGLAKRNPGTRLYGLDASDQMLATARTKVRRKGFDRIDLRQCLAEDLDHQDTFGLHEPFDAIFFSYALTMMPSCLDALDAALRNLKPGGSIYIVDFWDQRDLPWAFRSLLKKWLRLFHVVHRPEVMSHLEILASAGKGELHLEPVARRYAYIARFTTSDPRPQEANCA